jgi:hypothetical protein
MRGERKQVKKRKERKTKPPSSTEPMSVALPWLFVAAIARIRLVNIYHILSQPRLGGVGAQACRAGKKKSRKAHEIPPKARQDGCLARK